MPAIFADPQPRPVEAEPGETVETKRTYCKVCMTMCGLVAEVADNRKILKVKADTQHPVTEGYSCPKGRATGQIQHLDDPITQPMMRKNGALVAVDWNEALDDVAARLRAVIAEHGEHAVGMYFGSGLGLDAAGYSMEEIFHKALNGPPKFSPLTNDGTSKVAISGAMTGFYGVNPKVDYDNVELVLYIGTNPMVSHAHNTGMFKPGNWLKAINKRGGEIWVIDPVRTETAAFATGHLTPYPGKDYAILAWIVRELLVQGARATLPPVKNLDLLRELVSGVDRATASAIAGVPEAQMQDLLDAIRRRGTIGIETGTGVTMSAGCNLTVWLAWVIGILTGSMNRPGGFWMHPGSVFPFDQFVEHLPLMDSAFTRGPKTRPDVKGIMGEWPCAVLAPEIEAGNIRAFFNFGGHVLRSFPDRNALTQAFDKLDLHVGFEIVHNELSEHVTHLLPTKSAVERPEFTRWDTLAWNVSLQYSDPLVEPMGERRSAWWVIAEIMRRTGMAVPDHVPHDDTPENDHLMLASLMQSARCSYDELRERKYVEFDTPFPAPWLDRLIERNGGWNLAPAEIAEQWREFAARDAAQAGQPRPLVYSPRRQRRKFNGQLGFLGEICELLIHPETAAQHGVDRGDMVRVHNKSGEITVPVRFDPDMARGVCSIPHGHFEANINYLTSAQDMDRLGGMALYSGVPIELEPLGPPEGLQAGAPGVAEETALAAE